jgi:hypothetical protein
MMEWRQQRVSVLLPSAFRVESMLYKRIINLILPSQNILCTFSVPQSTKIASTAASAGQSRAMMEWRQQRVSKRPISHEAGSEDDDDNGDSDMNDVTADDGDEDMDEEDVGQED